MDPPVTGPSSPMTGGSCVLLRRGRALAGAETARRGRAAARRRRSGAAPPAPKATEAEPPGTEIAAPRPVPVPPPAATARQSYARIPLSDAGARRGHRLRAVARIAEARAAARLHAVSGSAGIADGERAACCGPSAHTSRATAGHGTRDAAAIGRATGCAEPGSGAAGAAVGYPAAARMRRSGGVRHPRAAKDTPAVRSATALIFLIIAVISNLYLQLSTLVRPCRMGASQRTIRYISENEN